MSNQSKTKTIELENAIRVIFPVVWLDKNQRNYQSKFCRALSKIQDRIGCYCGYNINPPAWIEFEIYGDVKEGAVEKLVKEVSARILFYRNAGVLA